MTSIGKDMKHGNPHIFLVGVKLGIQTWKTIWYCLLKLKYGNSGTRYLGNFCTFTQGKIYQNITVCNSKKLKTIYILITRKLIYKLRTFVRKKAIVYKRKN